MLTDESDGSLVRFQPNGQQVDYRFPLIENKRSTLHDEGLMSVSLNGRHIAVILNDYEDNEDYVRVYDLSE